MNLSLEFASVVPRGVSDGRFLVWVANGPAACELDLWGLYSSRQVEVSVDQRPLCEVLLRKLAHALAGGEPEVTFVPRVEAAESPWQVGLRFGSFDVVDAQPPSARTDSIGGERVQTGDPAFRIILAKGDDSLTLRTDRVGVKELEARCREAVQLRRGRSDAE